MHLSYAQIPYRQVGLRDITDRYALSFVAPKVRDAAIKTAAAVGAVARGFATRWPAAWRSAPTAIFGPRLTSIFWWGKRPLSTTAGWLPSGRVYRLRSTASGSTICRLWRIGPQLEEVLNDPSRSQGLAVVPIEALIYMKLRARRRQDLLNMVELIKAGADVRRVRRYLEQYAGDLVAVFDGLVEEALEG